MHICESDLGQIWVTQTWATRNVLHDDHEVCVQQAGLHTTDAHTLLRHGKLDMQQKHISAQQAHLHSKDVQHHK
eukprot:812830-Pelagomonas_calceolata.AAC.4